MEQILDKFNKFWEETYEKIENNVKIEILNVDYSTPESFFKDLKVSKSTISAYTPIEFSVAEKIMILAAVKSNRKEITKVLLALTEHILNNKPEMLVDVNFRIARKVPVPKPFIKFSLEEFAGGEETIKQLLNLPKPTAKDRRKLAIYEYFYNAKRTVVVDKTNLLLYPKQTGKTFNLAEFKDNVKNNSILIESGKGFKLIPNNLDKALRALTIEELVEGTILVEGKEFELGIASFWITPRLGLDTLIVVETSDILRIIGLGRKCTIPYSLLNYFENEFNIETTKVLP